MCFVSFSFCSSMGDYPPILCFSNKEFPPVVLLEQVFRNYFYPVLVMETVSLRVCFTTSLPKGPRKVQAVVGISDLEEWIETHLFVIPFTIAFIEPVV